MPGSFIPNITALARGLRARGDDFTFVAIPVPGATWHDDVRASGARLVVAAGARAAYEAIVAARPDVIHTHFLGLTVPATLAAWRSGARLFWHLHTGQSRPMNAPRRLRGSLRYRILGSRAQRFVTVSRSLANELAQWGVDGGKTIVINNAIDTDRFRPPTAAEREERRERLGLAPGERAFLFFGRDTYYKGTDVLLGALEARPPLTVVAVGLPEETRLALEERVRTVALERVADVRELYWAVDGLLMPSRFESAPYTLMEALACALPAAVSDIPPMRELANGVASVRFAAREDAGALSRAMSELPEAGASATLDAATRERFGLERWVRDVLSLYN